jgi:hypothetical protein
MPSRGDGVELDGHAPGGGDALAHGGRKASEVGVAGHQLAPGVDDRYQGPAEVGVGVAHGSVEGAGVGVLEALERRWGLPGG